MSFIEIVQRAGELLRQRGRISLRALQREFELDDATLEDLVEELVDAQRIAAREGKILSWITCTGTAAPEEASPEAAGVRQAAEAERRQLTVLFCDLVDSTRLAAGLDPEDWREVVRGYQQSAAEVIERFDGHVAQYLGDGLLVYFGWPRAHEDDAERAVRASLGIVDAIGERHEALQAKHGIELAVRVGIHTGPVVVGEMGSRAKSETLALGDTTNIAARLESVADSGSVVISGATLRLVPGMFVTKDLGAPPLKGIAEPFRAYAVLQATGVRSRLDVDPGRLTPLVGRDQEVGLLLDRWEGVREGEGQTVLVLGEAGMGKSRLARALRERLLDEAHTWLECRCSPYTQNSPLHPTIELIRQGLAIQEGEAPDSKLQKLEAGLGSALALEEAVPLFGALIGVPLPERYPQLQLSPEFQRRKTLEALVAWTLALGELQPVLLLIEDLHWADPSSLELLGMLIEQSPTTKVLVVLTARPEFEPPWPARSSLTSLALNRLTRRQARQMAASLAPGRTLPEAALETVVARADGIPLYVEELTKGVLESGLLTEHEGRYQLEGDVAELAIPATLQDSLMARLDRLSVAKPMAQVASALGREFPYWLLAAVAEVDEPTLRQGLARLVEAELLFQRGVAPSATYTFKHALIQDTAYQSLLRSQRQQIHARVALTLEERVPERMTSEPEVVAWHFENAGLPEQAIAHYRQAGENAAERSANSEAISHLTKALRLLDDLPETRARDEKELELQLALGAPLGAARGYGDPGVQRVYDRARQLCGRIGEAPQLFPALWGLHHVQFNLGELLNARKLAEQLMRLARSVNDSGMLLEAHHAHWSAASFQGEFAEAELHLSEGLTLYRPAQHGGLAFRYGAHDPGVCCHMIAALTRWALGHPDQAVQRSHESIVVAETLGHPYSLCMALCFAAALHALRRDEDRITDLAETMISLATEHGFPTFLGAGAFFRAYDAATDQPAAGLVREMQGELARLAGAGTRAGATLLLRLLADIEVRMGQRDAGLATLAGAFDVSNRLGERFVEADLHRGKGEILLLEDESAQPEAEACFRRAIGIARSQAAKSLELRAATSLARLWQRQGRRTAARDLLAPIYDWFGEGFDTQDLKDAKALLEELA